MILADMRGRFLYEVRPDLFPQGFLTDIEQALWALFYQERKAAKPRGY